MVRFFVSPEELDGEVVFLKGENAQHAKVLRLKVNEPVLVCDGAGREALCRIRETGDWELSVEEMPLEEAVERVMTNEICCNSSAHALLRVKVRVYLSFPKADKLEHVIQKATELGAYEIIAFPSARCVSKPDDKSLKKKLERWQKIAASAAEHGKGVPLPVRSAGRSRRRDGSWAPRPIR